jgi:hypothetical protein
MGSRVTWGICDQGISKVALVLNFDNVLGVIEFFFVGMTGWRRK